MIRITLNNNPELFYKEKEGNKYYFIENKTKYYLQKKVSSVYIRDGLWGEEAVFVLEEDEK